MTDATNAPSPIREINAVPTNIQASKIDPDPRNPRTFFDPSELAELTASIKDRGLLQPILVRLGSNGRFLIVFGERRWRAFTQAHGANAEMPVLVCEMTDEDALQAQIDENEIRVEPSETEQSDAAARVLEACHGDRAEAIRRLGWSSSKFDRRMALTKLAPRIKKALNERRIKLGHAELIAAVPVEKQETALSTIILNNIDVAGTRDLLARMSHQLAAATFDKTECATCQFNSTLQRTLFETAVGDGACTNPTCYQIKTVEANAAPTQAPPSEKPTPAAKPAPATTKSKPIIAAPVAVETSDVLPPSASVAPEIIQENVPEDEKVETMSPVASIPAPKPEAAPEPQDDKRMTALRSACRSKLRNARETIWRRALARHLAETPDHAKLALVAGGYAGQLQNLSRTTLPARAAQLISANFAKEDPAEQLAAVIALDATAIERAYTAISAAYAMDVPNFAYIEALAIAFAVDIRAIWTVDKSFLGNFTKDELTFIALKSDLTSTIGAKEFSKITKGKRDDLIKAMLTAPDFNWAGRLPSCMTIDGRYGAPPSVAVEAKAA